MRGRLATSLEDVLSSVRRSRAAQQSGLLIGAQGLSTLLSFTLTILITKGLAVADYGSFRYAMTFLTFAMTVLQLGWPYSASRLLAMEDGRDAQRAIVGACFVIVSVTTLLGVAGTTAGLLVAERAGYQPARLLFWVAPFVYVTLGQGMITSLCQGLNRISVLAVQQVLPYLLLIPVTAIQIYALHEYSLVAAIVGYVAVFTIVLAVGFTRLGVKFADTRRWVRAIAAENWRTGFPIYVGGLFGVASAQFVALLAAQFTTAAEYGQYALAMAVSTPVGVLISSIGTVIFRSSSGRRSLTPKVIGYSVALGVLVCATFLLATQFLLALAFGARYWPSVRMAQLQVFGAVMIGWGDILQRFLGAQGLGRRLGSAAVATGVVGTSAAALLLPRIGIYGAIISAVLGSATYLGSMIILYRRHSAGSISPEARRGDGAATPGTPA